VEICVLVALRMDGDSRIGSVSSCGIINNGNPLLSAPVVKDAKNGSDGDKKGKENASDDSGGGTSRFLVFLN